MILSGRYGTVKYDPSGAGGATLVDIISINGFKLSWKTEYEDVTSYLDTNRVYVPNLPDVGGTLSGFWNSADKTLFEAAMSPTPGMLALIPNTTEPTHLWQGLAYLDAEIDASLAAPKLSGSFRAAGPWSMEPASLAERRRAA